MTEPFDVFPPLEIVSVEEVPYGGYGLNPGCLIEITGREGTFEIVRRHGKELAVRVFEGDPFGHGWWTCPQCAASVEHGQQHACDRMLRLATGIAGPPRT